MAEASIPKWINFDQYQRYHFVERIINAYSGERKLKILEVGGAFSSALQHLAAKHEIWIADSIQAADIHVRASGQNLPFQARTFDVVVCTDVLEHVPEQQRKSLLQELQRITSGILILGFPHDTPESKAADRILSDWIRETRGSDYAFLSEHSTYGLPDAIAIKNMLQENGGMILEALNANVYSWLPLMMSYFAIEKHEEFEESKKVLNELFNSNYDALSHTAPAYRTFYIWFSIPHYETSFHNVKSALVPASEDAVHDFAWSSLVLSLSFQRALRRVQDLAKLRLDQYDASRTEIETIRKSSIELEAHLKSLNREIQLLQDQRVELITKVDNVGEELKERAERMKQQDRNIDELEKKTVTLHGTIERQRQVIEQREQNIDVLKRDLTEARRIQHETVEESDKQLSGLRMQLRSTIREYDHQIAGMKSQLHHTQEYLNLFLNHPVYKAYKFFKRKSAAEPSFSQPEQREDRASTEVEDEADLLLDRADRSFSAGDLEYASQIYRKVLSKNNRSERAISGLVRLLQGRGEFEEAQRILNDSLNRDPGSLPLLLLLAGSCLSTGSFWEAERLYQRILDSSPKNIEALLGLADLSMGDAQYTNAFMYYQQVLQFDPQNLTALSGLAECSLHFPDAKKYADELRKCLPADSLLTSVLKTPEIEIYRPLVSIIIPVFNQLHYTRKCIEEIRHSTGNPYELIIVDNGSSDGTREYLDSLRADGVKIKHNTENLGFVDACNQGAELAAGEYLVFLNNDTIPGTGWLESLVETAENDSSVGAVGAKLVYPDGVLQEAGSLIFSDGTAWNYGKGDHPDKPEYNYVRESPYCSAACLLIRRELFREIGGFDQRYSPAYWEDVDLAFEIRKRGFKVVYQPAAEIVHFEGVTGGTDVTSGYKKYQIRNQEIFKSKWAFELEAQPRFDKDKLKSASIQNLNARILAVDHYLPVFDRNSGNHRAYQLMRLIRKADHPITFVARNGEYQTRYKRMLESLGIETYGTDRAHLETAGHIPRCDPIQWENLLNQGEYKIAILSRYQNARTYLPLIRVHSPETKIVLDTVDVHFLREQRKADLYGTSHLREQASQTRQDELEVCKQADALIAVTEEDATVLRNALGSQKPIWIIPNIHPVEKDPKGFDARTGLLFVGNFVHPPNSDAMYHFCNQILPLIRKKLPDIYLYIVGGNSIPLLQDLRSDDRVIITGYVPSTKPFLDHCKLSINPLRYGAGMKGKIGEAMAHGLPVVTSTIGAEGFNLQAGTHALVEDSPEEFANAVIMAYSVESLWNRLSENGVKMIEDRYSPDAVFPAVRSLLDWNFNFSASSASSAVNPLPRYTKK